jgi:hypothetical protein
VSEELKRRIADDAYAASFQTMSQYRSALLKAADSTQDVARAPEGWKLAPIEPTVNMLRAGNDAMTNAGPLRTATLTWCAMLAATPAAPCAVPHSDDEAVDRFAVELKEKLAESRTKGRRGWQHCDPDYLSECLREHVEKGDPRDVAAYCMMLWHQGKAIASTAYAEQQPDPLVAASEALRIAIEAHSHFAAGLVFGLADLARKRGMSSEGSMLGALKAERQATSTPSHTPYNWRDTGPLETGDAS